MSNSRQRVRLFRATHAVVSTAILFFGACNRAASTVAQPTIAAKDDGGERRFPGVDIVPTRGAGFLIRIRGEIAGGGQPLYVIDGAPMHIDSHRGIDWIRPEDIADIKVLKYPQELAEFGPDGANGVVVINTNRSPRRR
jgi:hypothetical protein